MLKNLKGAFLVLILVGNLLAVFPQTIGETEGCDTECCAVSGMSMHSQSAASQAVRAVCIIQCRPSSETPPSFSILAGLAPAKQTHTVVLLTLAVPATDYLVQARFPSSPTSSFNGSSHRFLENSSFLI